MDYDLMVRAVPTPNPNAFKFVMNSAVKNEGKATFNSTEECKEITLFTDLFSLGSVVQVHVFENIMTLTFREGEDILDEKVKVESILKTRMPIHDPGFQLEVEKIKKKTKENLSPEAKEIEDILDRTIRPGLQADGGDVEIVEYKDNLLTIRYEGACGSCPSAMYGTLDAILSILQAEFNPKLDITIAPMEYD